LSIALANGHPHDGRFEAAAHRFDVESVRQAWPRQ